MTPFSMWNMNIKIQLQCWQCTCQQVCYIYVTINILCYASQLKTPFMVAKSTNLCKLSRSKAPKTQHFKHVRKKNSNFFSHLQPGCSISARKNAAYLGSYAKVSIAVQSIIPWSRNSMFVVVVALRYQS